MHIKKKDSSGLKKHVYKYMKNKPILIFVVLFVVVCILLFMYLFMQKTSLTFVSLSEKTPGKVTVSGEKTVVFGVLSDIHGDQKRTEYLATLLKNMNIDAYIVSGDISLSFGDEKGSENDVEEILLVLVKLLNTQKPVFVIPGNHETQKAYFTAVQVLQTQYSNLFDLQSTVCTSFKNITIIGLGGIENKQFMIPGGFNLNITSIKTCNMSSKNPVVLITHNPKKYSTKNGLDYVKNVDVNIGSSRLSKLIDILNAQVVISGHIHEARGIIGTDEININPGHWSNHLELNPGAVYDYSGDSDSCAGIIELKGYSARGFLVC